MSATILPFPAPRGHGGCAAHARVRAALDGSALWVRSLGEGIVEVGNPATGRRALIHGHGALWAAFSACGELVARGPAEAMIAVVRHGLAATEAERAPPTPES